MYLASFATMSTGAKNLQTACLADGPIHTDFLLSGYCGNPHPSGPFCLTSVALLVRRPFSCHGPFTEHFTYVSVSACLPASLPHSKHLHNDPINLQQACDSGETRTLSFVNVAMGT